MPGRTRIALLVVCTLLAGLTAGAALATLLAGGSSARPAPAAVRAADDDHDGFETSDPEPHGFGDDDEADD